MIRHASSALAAASLIYVLGCGEKNDPGPAGASSSAAAAPALAAPAGPIVEATCETTSIDDHSCLELGDDELANEREGACEGKFVRDAACSRESVVGVCRLPDGTVRFGYPPKTLALLEKACQGSQGRFAAGDKPPTPDLVTMTSCVGKYEGACEEEEVHATPRLKPAEDECRTFGGVFHAGTGCPRETALALCDLKGKRTVVLSGPPSLDARKRFCSEREGKLFEAVPSPSSSASAAPAVDEDPRAPKPDAIIRVQ